MNLSPAVGCPATDRHRHRLGSHLSPCTPSPAGLQHVPGACKRLKINTDNDAGAEMRIVLNGVDGFGAQDLVL